MKSRVICVLGMHRSGTSAVTRILNLLGVYLGPADLCGEAGPDNPKGYWENPEFRNINEEILHRFGGSWDDPPSFSPGWEQSVELHDLRQRARAIIQEQGLAAAPLWGWKDPRTCLTLPFWQQVIPSMSYVICLRNPLDVAYSLLQRDGFSIDKGAVLWLKYLHSSLSCSRGQPRVMLFYEDLMDDPYREVRKLARFVGLSEASDLRVLPHEISSFLEDSLFHNRSPLEMVLGEQRLPFQVKAAFSLLKTYVSVCDSGLSDSHEYRSHTLIDTVEKIFHAALNDVLDVTRKNTHLTQLSQEKHLLEKQYEDIVAVRSVQEREIARLNAELTAAHTELKRIAETLSLISNSTSWRITKPIRLLGDLLKSLRAARRGPISERRLVERSRLFDARWYLTQNDDVRKAGVDPAWHYLVHGWREGRDPGPRFSTLAYLKRNPDVAAAGINPLIHYLRYGKQEGREVDEKPEEQASRSRWKRRHLGIFGSKRREGRIFSARLSVLSRPPLSGFSFAQGGLRGQIEKLHLTSNRVVLTGWLFHCMKEIRGITLMLEGSGRKLCFSGHYGIERLDVLAVHHNNHAIYSGFRVGASHPLKGRISLSLKVEYVDLATEILRLGTCYPSYDKFRLFALRVLRLLTARNVKKALRLLFAGKWTTVRDRLLREAASLSPVTDTPSLAHLLDLVQARPQKPPSLPEEVDIILPVFNAFEHLTRCVDTILKNTRGPFRLIVVDDCSSDPRILPFLATLKELHPNTVVLRTPTNSGFVAAANLGLRNATNHCVLLNSDVAVPPGWLERLMSPIFFSPKNVASTTPFTNAGTICSFPVPLKDNDITEIFPNLDLTSIDAVFAQVKTDNIQIPTAVGFCMGMSKYALDKVGYFDEVTFGKGYGEENDWSMRAAQHGFQHLLVTNLFVHHTHAGSFTQSEKRELLTRNLARLEAKHPKYTALVQEHINADPARPIRDLIFLLLACQSPVALIIDHDLGGGANEFRRRLIIDALSRGFTILLLTYNPGDLNHILRCYYRSFVLEFRDATCADLLRLANIVPIKEIYYNNAVGFPEPLKLLATLAELKRHTQAQMTVAIHDFYPICPSYTLLDHEGRFCGVPDLETCTRCLPRNKFCRIDEPESGIQGWRGAWGVCLALADSLLCFSHSSRELVQRAYPGLPPEKFVVLPHPPLELLRKPNLASSSDLCIGVVGAINFAKGSRIVKELAHLIRLKNIAARVVVIGSFGEDYDPDILTVTGAYQRQELPDLIERFGINVFLVPSICPETFCFVVQELMEMGVPVAVFDLGAQAERVRSYRYGRVIPSVSAEAALQTLSELHREFQRETAAARGFDRG